MQVISTKDMLSFSAKNKSHSLSTSSNANSLPKSNRTQRLYMSDGHDNSNGDSLHQVDLRQDLDRS